MSIDGDDVIAGFIHSRETEQKVRLRREELRFDQITKTCYVIESNVGRVLATFTYRQMRELEDRGRNLRRPDPPPPVYRWTIQYAQNFEWVDMREPMYGKYDRNDDDQMVRALELLRGLNPEAALRLVLTDKKHLGEPISFMHVAHLVFFYEEIEELLANIRPDSRDLPRFQQLLKKMNLRNDPALSKVLDLEGVPGERSHLIQQRRQKRISLMKRRISKDKTPYKKTL